MSGATCAPPACLQLAPQYPRKSSSNGHFARRVFDRKQFGNIRRRRDCSPDLAGNFGSLLYGLFPRSSVVINVFASTWRTPRTISINPCVPLQTTSYDTVLLIPELTVAHYRGCSLTRTHNSRAWLRHLSHWGPRVESSGSSEKTVMR